MQELKDEVLEEEREEGKNHSERPPEALSTPAGSSSILPHTEKWTTTESTSTSAEPITMRGSLERYSLPSLSLQPQPVSKNVPASSRDRARPGSSTGGGPDGVVVRPVFSVPTADGLEEEADKEGEEVDVGRDDDDDPSPFTLPPSLIISTTQKTYTTRSHYPTPTRIPYYANSRREEETKKPVYQGPLIPMSSTLTNRAEERRRKMEELLSKLSEKYNSQSKGSGEKEEAHWSDDGVLTWKEKEKVETAERMKAMIESLKERLASSRPGVHRLGQGTLDMEARSKGQPSPSPSAASLSWPTTTLRPLGLDTAEEMIGEKLRELSSGIHRLDLEQVIDLDLVSLQQPSPPSATPGYRDDGVGDDLSTSPSTDEKKLPKRHLIHPRLTYQRPEPALIHRPSVNLKSHITPVTEAALPHSTRYHRRPVIPRYSDVSPPPGNYHPNSYMSRGHPQRHYGRPPPGPPGPSPPPSLLRQPRPTDIRGLPRKKTTDPHPETKELPPYHNPSPAPPANYMSVLAPTEPTPMYMKEAQKHGGRRRPASSSHQPKLKHDPSEHGSPPSGRYVHTNSYREGPPQPPPSPSPSPHRGYAPPKKAYLPPPPPPGRKGKSGRKFESEVTKYPPPSANYKQPNLHFDHNPKEKDSLHVIPQDALKTTMHPPHVSYLPPNKYMSTMTPPAKGYSTPPPAYMSSMKPPKKEYLHPPEKEYMSTSMKPPSKKYLPPHKDMSTMAPPLKEYHVPEDHVSAMAPPHQDYLPPKGQSMVPPSKNYLPPEKHMNKMTPPHHEYHPQTSHQYSSTMRPPHKDYHAPKSQMSTMRPPHKEYLLPQPQGTTMAPPNKNYLPPKTHMSTMAPPNKNYIPPQPHGSTMAPPNKDYLPPKAHMNTMIPPHEKYVPPQPHGSAMVPPSKGYLPPKTHVSTMSPPHQEYLPPKPHGSEVSPPQKAYAPPISHATSMKPPSKDYIPPYHGDMTPPSTGYDSPKHHMSSMSPPSKSYHPPAGYMSTMVPPKKSYVPPKGYMSNMTPPDKSYLPPKYMSTIAPPLHPPKKHHVGVMSPPKHSYLPPKKEIVATMTPPNISYQSPSVENYVPPISTVAPPLREYLSPKAEHMAPPNQEYLPPPLASVMGPPKKDYHPPETGYANTMAPPSKQYLPPKGHASTLAPPRKNYLPPSRKPSPPPPPPGKNFASMTPHKKYLPPKYVSTMSPPKAEYHPPTESYNSVPHVTTMAPPTKKYAPPKGKYMGTLKPPKNYLPLKEQKSTPVPTYQEKLKANTITSLSKAHFQSCPEISNKSHEICKNYQHDTCWSPGVRDLDCPLSGLCCFDGCVNSCLPPNYVHGASEEAVRGTASYSPSTPSYSTRSPAPPPDRRRPPQKHAACPRREPKAHCPPKGTVHQCWSPGVPDLDCPGSGLCCFDGCVNVCIMGHHEVHNGNDQYHLHHHHHHHHLHPISYHTPPNTKYLVPSSVFIPHEAIHGGKEGSKENVKVVDVGYEDGRVPMLAMEELYSLKELDEAHNQGKDDKVGKKIHTAGHSYPAVMLHPPAHYMPPAQEYLPPRDYLAPSYHEMKPPHRNYLPPKAHPDLEDDYAKLHMAHMTVPTVNYFPPREYEHASPPPAETNRRKPVYKQPTPHYDNSLGKFSSMPTSYHSSEKYYYRPEYHAPSHESGPHYQNRHESTYKLEIRTMKPPSKQYLQPNEFQPRLGENYKNQNKLGGHRTPAKAYVPPPPRPDVGTSYKPPAKEYLPPPEYLDKKEGEHYKPPSKEYLPPPRHHNKGEHYKPPSKKYLPPPEYHEEKEGEYYKPPSKEYLPPPTYHEKEKEEHYKPPSKEYLTPIEYHEKEKGEHYKPPSKEYLPPPQYHEKEKGEHYKPPSKEYLPPPQYHEKEKGEHYKPPSKEYLPPPSYDNNKEHHLHPPTEPTPKYLTELGEHYKLPSKEYLPPTLPHKEEDILHYKPPIKEYLPPPLRPKVKGVPYKLPSKEYLPPPPPPTYEEEKKHLQLPSKEYLPPHGPKSKFHPPDFLPHPSPLSSPVDLDAPPHIIINGDKVPLPLKDPEGYVVPPHTLPPHSINIQINIPNKDEFSVNTPRDLLPEGHLPPPLPSYIPPGQPIPKPPEPLHHPQPRVHPAKEKLAVNYLPPAKDYKPPSGEYLPPPPPPPPEYHSDDVHLLGDPDAQLVPPNLLPHHNAPSSKVDVVPLSPPTSEYLPPPPRGPQFPPLPPPPLSPDLDPLSLPVSDYLPPPPVRVRPDYLPPPPRPQALLVEPPEPPPPESLPQVWDAE